MKNYEIKVNKKQCLFLGTVFYLNYKILQRSIQENIKYDIIKLS